MQAFVNKVYKGGVALKCYIVAAICSWNVNVFLPQGNRREIFWVFKKEGGFWMNSGLPLSSQASAESARVPGLLIYAEIFFRFRQP